MPDITMCPSETCPARETCKRSPASGTKPSEWQWWFTERTIEPCEYYWRTARPE